MFCEIDWNFDSCIVMTSTRVFLMINCILSVLLRMPFALSCRTLRKFFGDVVFVCALWVKVLKNVQHHELL